MRKKGKVLDMAAKTTGKTVRLPDAVHEDILATIKEVTGVKPVMLDFVLEALEEKMKPYREQLEAKRKVAAESKHRKREAS